MLSNSKRAVEHLNAPTGVVGAEAGLAAKFVPTTWPNNFVDLVPVGYNS
jgi:hypothetical protein